MLQILHRGRDALRIVKRVMLEMIKAIVPRVAVMRDLPECGDFITQLLKIRGPLLNIGARLRLIRLSAVTRGHQPGKQGSATWRATWRRHESAGERQPRNSETLHVGRA